MVGEGIALSADHTDVARIAKMKLQLVNWSALIPVSG